MKEIINVTGLLAYRLKSTCFGMTDFPPEEVTVNI